MGRVAFVATLLALLGGVLVACGSKEDPNARKGPETAVITGDGVSLRTDPLATAAEIDSLKQGMRVIILKRSATPVRVAGFNKHWYFVKLPSGLKGWIYGAKVAVGNASVSTQSAGKVLPKNFQEKVLVGKWWEVRADGSTGYRKIYFWPDNKYKFGYGNALYGDGKYEVLAYRRKVYLDKGSGVGDMLEVTRVGNDLRLLAVHKGERYTFRRGDSNPDGKEVGLKKK